MNDINIKFIDEDNCKINGEVWTKAGMVKEVEKSYFPKPNRGQVYYHLDCYGEIKKAMWGNSARDDNCFYQTFNCWLNKTEIETYVKYYKGETFSAITLAIRRWQIANGLDHNFHHKKNYLDYYSSDYPISDYHAAIDANWKREPEYTLNMEMACKCLRDLYKCFNKEIKK